MFSSTKEFKKEYQTRLAMRYGNTVEDAHPTELYDILGEMVRDYAGKFWRDTRNEVIKGKKQWSIGNDETKLQLLMIEGYHHIMVSLWL